MKMICAVGVPFALLWIYFSYQEIVQFVGNFESHQNIEKKGCCAKIRQALKEHYSRSWNYIDTYMMIQVPLILVASILPRYGITLWQPKYIIWQTLGCQISMWFKLFDWLRLFTKTAIYPILLREVLYDIYPFVIIMLVILGLFGNCLFIFSSLAVYEGKPSLYSELLPN